MLRHEAALPQQHEARAEVAVVVAAAEVVAVARPASPSTQGAKRAPKKAPLDLGALQAQAAKVRPCRTPRHKVPKPGHEKHRKQGELHSKTKVSRGVSGVQAPPLSPQPRPSALLPSVEDRLRRRQQRRRPHQAKGRHHRGDAPGAARPRRQQRPLLSLSTSANIAVIGQQLSSISLGMTPRCWRKSLASL